MKQLIQLLVIALVISVLILSGYYAYFVMPQKVEESFVQTLEATGFENVKYEAATHKNGAVIFSNITLDKNSFSHIKTASLEYSLFDYVLSSGMASKLTINELRLTGSLDKNWKFEISGHPNPDYLLTVLHAIPFKTIEFKNSSIDILSAQYGGVKLDYDALLRKNKETFDISSSLKSVQQQLSVQGKVNGTLYAQGQADLKLDIQQFQIEQDNYKISRANAKGDVVYTPGKAADITLEIGAGAAKFYGLPVQNITMTYTGKAQNYSIKTEGTTTGAEQIDVSALLSNQSNDKNLQATITSKKAENIISYLESNDILPKKHNLPDLISKTEDVSIIFDMAPLLDEDIYNGSFEFGTEQPAFKAKGRFELDPESKKITGTFALPETKKNIKSLKNDDISINFDLSSIGAFKLAHWNTRKIDFSWSLSLIPQNGQVSFGPIKLYDIKGNIEYSSDKEQSSNKKLNFLLPLKSYIQQKGNILLNFAKKSNQTIEKFKLNIYGGTIETEPLTLKNGYLPNHMTLLISDISSSRFIKDALVTDMDIAGQVGGKITLEVENGQIHIKNGLLQSQSNGVVSLSENLRYGLFPDATEQAERIRNSLANFFYEYFELRLDGSLSEGVMMTLNTRGHNPELKDNDPLDLSLQIETDLSDLFKPLLKN